MSSTKKMMKPFWLHCNLCGQREAAKYKITNCGFIVCDSERCGAHVTSKDMKCKDCKGPCRRLMDLDSAPEEVMTVFQPVTDQIFM